MKPKMDELTINIKREESIKKKHISIAVFVTNLKIIVRIYQMVDI